MIATDRRLLAVAVLIAAMGVLGAFAPGILVDTPSHVRLYDVVAREVVMVVHLAATAFAAFAIFVRPAWRRGAAWICALLCLGWAAVTLLPWLDDRAQGNVLGTAVWVFAAYVSADSAP